jgi:hypothetical protein
MLPLAVHISLFPSCFAGDALPNLRQSADAWLHKLEVYTVDAVGVEVEFQGKRHVSTGSKVHYHMHAL